MTLPDSSTLRTALFDAHLQSGGKMVPFAGWEMPVQYSGVKNEVLALRAGCGVFDVSHMGQLDVRGENVTQELNKIVSADWSKTPVGRAAYALLLSDSGGVLDDIMGYHLAEDHWLVVANASRAEGDEAHLRKLLPPAIELKNRYEDQVMIAVQGPTSEQLLQPFCDADLSELSLRDVRPVKISAGVLRTPGLIVRGGYTGCDGFEWIGDADTGVLLWQELIAAGAVPCGLGARDVLRLEAGLPLYGHELREDWTPDESNVSFAVKMGKGDFYGRDALLQKPESLNPKTIRGLQMDGRGIAREGYIVTRNETEIGEVTSGTPSPTLETNIALALLPADLPNGTEVQVVIRGANHAAKIVPLPFVPRTTKKATR
jgi:aminomethyltransferase